MGSIHQNIKNDRKKQHLVISTVKIFIPCIDITICVCMCVCCETQDDVYYILIKHKTLMTLIMTRE